MVQINLVHPGQRIRQHAVSKEKSRSCISFHGNRPQGPDNICYRLNMKGAPPAYAFEHLIAKGGGVLGAHGDLKR